MSKYLITQSSDKEAIKNKICSEIDEFNGDLEVVVGAAKNSRSLQQNNLQYTWHMEASEQGDCTASEYRAYCKAHFGIPILFESNPDFRDKFKKITIGMNYEQKMLLMTPPVDFPITSLMTVKQHSEYLDKVYVFYTSKGFRLSLPTNSSLNGACN